MNSRINWLVTIVLFCAVCSGCVRESTEGDKHIYQYELWVSGAIFLAGIVAAVAGLALRKSSGRYGWTMLILGPVLVLGVAPSMFLDHVDVGPDGFSRHSGIWGMTAVQDVAFADVSRLQVETREERGRRGRKVERQYLVCYLKNGEKVELPAGNDVAREAVPQIAEIANNKGIQVVWP